MNIWKQFAAMLPGDPLLIGQVISLNGDGTSTVELLDGATIRVRGTSVAEGSKAYVRAGAIEGEAPNLPVFDVEI